MILPPDGQAALLALPSGMEVAAPMLQYGKLFGDAAGVNRLIT